MKAQVFAVLCLAIVVASQSCATAPFGAATGFNLFVLSSSQTLDGCNSDVEGAVAGAGPINLISYKVGLKTPSSFPYDYTLVSAGPISFVDGSVIGGGIIGSSVNNINRVDIQPNGAEGSVFDASCCQDSDCYACTAGPSFINFNEARNVLNALSDTFTTYDTTPDAQIVVRSRSVDLYCGSDAFNVFNGVSIDNTLSQLQIHCSASQTVLINYTPETTGYPAGFAVNLFDGITAGTVVHHFTNLFISFSTEVEGTLFAPRSCLSFPNGLITGDVIVDIFDTPGSCNGVQIDSAPFCGCIPVPPTTNYCCSYSRDTSTRTICSTLPCSYQSIPQWTFEGQAETDDCDDCCYLAAN